MDLLAIRFSDVEDLSLMWVGAFRLFSLMLLCLRKIDVALGCLLWDCFIHFLYVCDGSLIFGSIETGLDFRINDRGIIIYYLTNYYC